MGSPIFPRQTASKGCGESNKRGKTHYTTSTGLLELREAIAEYYLEKHGVSVSPNQVVVTNGSSPALMIILSVLLETGDEVILSDPHYACYPNIVRFLGCTPVFVKVNESDGFRFNPEDIKERIGSKTRAIIINSPANPMGNVLDVQAMRKVASLGPIVVSDEIYHGLVYEGKEHSILEFTDNAFVASGFSKQFAMTGWRLGYIIASERYMRPLQKLMQNFFIAANTISQWAGIAAIREAGSDIRRMVKILNKRRKLIIKRLRKIGFGVPVEPTGAFYVLANAKNFTNDSLKFAFELLEEAGVGVTPGIDFGRNAEGYLRFSYASSIENISAGTGRLERYLISR